MTNLNQSLTNIRNHQASAIAELESLMKQVPVPQPDYYLLPIPHVTQLNTNPDADDFNNDCGPACVAMILDNTATPDEIFRLIQTEDKYTDFWQLQRVMYDHFGLATNRENGVDIRDEYPNPLSGFRKNHFVTIVGFDDAHIIVNDPLRNEGGLKIRNDVFEKAWTTAYNALSQGAIVMAEPFRADPATKTIYEVVHRRGINIRNLPSIAGKDIGDLAPGTVRQVFEIVHIEGNNNIWGRIGDNRWMALIYNGVTLAEKV